MIRQSKKTGRNLYLKYLNICGANSNSYRLQDLYVSKMIYSTHSVSNRQRQESIIDKINNFDGMCYILIKFDGNERVEDYALLNNLIICWDNSIDAKRLKRIKKIKFKINS